MSMTEQQAYLFDNAWTEARRRLALLEELLDPLTFPRLERIGVGAGWHCLDVGAGGGSVARWLARRVGGAGAVHATDLNTRFLEALDEPNLTVHRHDITADPLPGGGYDLIHTRLVLMHLPEREAALRRLIAALKPGGWLLVEEWDVFSIAALAAGAYLRVWEAFGEATRRSGVRPEWARDLPAIVAGEGLAGVQVAADGSFFPGGSAEARFWALTWEQVRPHIEAAGATGAEFDDVRAGQDDPRRWFVGPTLVAVWGQRAAEPGGAGGVAP